MTHENLFKIYIPEPCGEDWDKMTPNRQGAYCKVCAKTVVDFSGKSDEEIKLFLLENTQNKICGRFMVNQLNDYKKDYPDKEIPCLKTEMPKLEFPGFLLPVLTPFRAYAMAMILIASLALSACGNSEGSGSDDGERLAGAVTYVDSTEFNNNKILGGISAENINNYSDSTCSTDTDDITVGKIKIENLTDTLKTDSTEIMIKGEIEPVQKTHGLLLKNENND